MSENSYRPVAVEIAYETPQRHGNAPTLVRLAIIFNYVSAGFDLIYVCISIIMLIFMHYAVTHAAMVGPPAAPLVPAPAPVAPIVPASAPVLTPGPGVTPGPEVPASAPVTSAPGLVAPALPPAGPVMAPPPAAPSFPPVLLFDVLYGVPAVLCLAACCVKIIGATKLMRGIKGVWGWGLAAAIVGSVPFWMLTICCPMALVPMGAGIYGIVILSLPHVRFYLNGIIAQRRNITTSMAR